MSRKKVSTRWQYLNSEQRQVQEASDKSDETAENATVAANGMLKDVTGKG